MCFLLANRIIRDISRVGAEARSFFSPLMTASPYDVTHASQRLTLNISFNTHVYIFQS